MQKAASSLAAVVALSSAAVAQTSAPKQQPVPASPFRNERFAEDWSHMVDPAHRTEPWHKLKWIDLGSGRHLTLGGDVKGRWESVDWPFFGATGAATDDYVLQRIMVHGDFRISRNVRVFGQLSLHESFGRTLMFPLDDGGGDLHQGFLELNGGSAQNGENLRIGRQEITLSPRFVHTRGAVNIRAAYDGVRGWLVRGPWMVEGFATRPVLNRTGTFDDRPDGNQTFNGLRVGYTFGQNRQWQAIGSLYTVDREVARIGAASGNDDRDSWGVRLFGTQSPWDFDAEHYWQRGHFAEQDIAAFGGGGDAGYTLKRTRFEPRVGLRWQYGSGDRNPTDGETNTFAGLLSRAPCCADPQWLAPTNIASLAPVVSFNPHATLAVELKADFIRRLEQSDALYTFPQIAYPGSVGQPGDAISVAPTLSLTWTPRSDVTVLGYFVSQSADGALAASGGRDSTFSAISVGLRF